jgi:ankyrin repeat protein
VNALGPNKTTALLEAADDGSLDTVRLLAEHGADLKTTNADGQNAVLLAVKDGCAGVTEFLLAKGVPANAKERGGDTALSYAQREHFEYLYEPLLKGGADPNVFTGNSSSLLIGEIEQGNVETVRILLKWGARPDGNNREYRPLDYAINSSRLPEEDARHQKRLSDSRKIVRLLLDAKANPNITDVAGRPVLFLAMDVGDGEEVKLLLDAGANPNARDNGQSALLEAVQKRHIHLIDLLLKAGADTKAVDEFGSTALMIAASNNDVDSVKLLLRHGANSRTKDSAGNDAAAYAKNNPRILALLKQAH